MQYLLIHGFGTKINYDLGFYQYPPTEDFLAWEKDTEFGNAKIFSWGIKQDKNWKNFANVAQYWELYNREKSLAANKYMLIELDKAIKETKPEIIVCHSMGAFLLENYCETYELPGCVKKIVFSQADIRTIPNLEKRLEKNCNLKLTNYYCGWDPALITSLALGWSRPAGLYGIKVKNELGSQIKNIFYPLGFSGTNLHIDAINSPKFKKLIDLDKS